MNTVGKTEWIERKRERERERETNKGYLSKLFKKRRDWANPIESSFTAVHPSSHVGSGQKAQTASSGAGVEHKDPVGITLSDRCPESTKAVRIFTTGGFGGIQNGMRQTTS